jgi:hypothetical protein
MTEVEFFHCASRTLILTDLIEAFEQRWLRLFEQNFRVVKWAPAGVRHSAGQLKLTSAVRGYAATQRGSES